MKKIFSLIITLILATNLLIAQNPTFRAQNTTTVSSDIIFDSFTDTSGTELTAHTGDLNASWVEHAHANYVAFIKISSTNTIFGEGTAAYYPSASPANANYTIDVDFCVKTAIAQSIGPYGRLDTTNDTGYLARLVDATTWQLRWSNNGAFTTLGTSTSDVPTAGGACINGKLVMNGNQISFVINNGSTVIGPFTDNNITAIGKAGIRNNGAATATTGTHLDNFRVYMN